MKRNIALLFFLFSMACYAAPTALTPMFENYLALQAALAGDNLQDAVNAAKKMQTSIPEKAKDEKMSEQLSSISLLAKNIGAAKDLEQARKTFGEMSVLMIALKSESGLSVSEYFCPMLKKSWLQKGDKVQNPYFGKQMSGCGEKKS
jgi:Cu(I)/Ag(I) efflux system membrane fusion protein